MDAVNCDATVLNEVCSQRRLGWLVVRDRKGGVKDDDKRQSTGVWKGSLPAFARFLSAVTLLGFTIAGKQWPSQCTV
jgi:hypothetical protein